MSLQPQTSQLEEDRFAETLGLFGELRLLTTSEAEEVMALFDPGFPFADALRAARSIHCHVKVDNTDRLPHAEILAAGGRAENAATGYVKYGFAGGLNLIFSSIPISEDDLLAERPPRAPAVLDHKGVDLRDESPEVRSVFDAVPVIASERGWRHVAQGTGDASVYCCHTEVQEKHWVYPTPDGARQSRPIELAFGELTIHASKMGCDLRPADPVDRPGDPVDRPG